MNKTVSIVITLGLVVALGIVFLGGSSKTQETVGQNVEVKGGVQFITINAKGGYTPTKSIAKSDIPTILRFDTNGTFDCSSSVRIPSMNISKMLPQSGSTDIDLGNPKLGTLQGTCGMGMYSFEVEFQS
jgi:plastocyanin domain-containing protein